LATLSCRLHIWHFSQPLSASLMQSCAGLPRATIPQFVDINWSRTDVRQNVWICRFSGAHSPFHPKLLVECFKVSISSTFLRTNFSYKLRFGSFSSYILALAKNSYEKFARLKLMKLAEDRRDESDLRILDVITSL